MCLNKWNVKNPTKLAPLKVSQRLFQQLTEHNKCCASRKRRGEDRKFFVLFCFVWFGFVLFAFFVSVLFFELFFLPRGYDPRIHFFLLLPCGFAMLQAVCHSLSRAVDFEGSSLPAMTIS